MLMLTEFHIGDYTYVPDFGTVSVSLKDHEGVEVHSMDVPFDADYSIPQDILNVSSGDILSFFKLTVKFTSENRQRIYTDIVRVHNDFMITSTPANLRNLLGLYEEELPDTEIDFIYSFNELVDEIGLELLEDTNARVNKLILLHEAVRHLPALGLKTLKSNEIDDTKKSRLSNINIKAVQDSITSQYWAHKLTFETVDDFPQDPLLEFITRTDPFTGEDA
jgi:hypothetical protein